MKTYVHLKVSAEGYKSGATNEDEIFLTPEMYEEIKEGLGTTMWFHELDGKHSEQEEDIFMQVVTEKDLENFEFLDSRSGSLRELVMYESPRSPEEFHAIHAEVRSYVKTETLTIKIHKKHKSELQDVLRRMGYVI